MVKYYNFRGALIVAAAITTLIMASCKKDKTPAPSMVTTTTQTIASPVKIGVFEADSGIYKLLFMVVSKIGTKTVDYDLIFDTGSGGMVIDANGIVPKSMIGTNGFNFTGDSTVVDGITITSQTSMIEYGADANTTTKVYGNLAYAAVSVGDKNGNVVIKRLPFFLYYKGVNEDGSTADPHSFDILGVNTVHDVVFNNGAYITSPLSYYEPGTGLTKGFKMAALGTSNFSVDGTYVPGVVTVGLTAADLTSNGFVMHPLTSHGTAGYPPYLPTMVTYNGKIDATYAIYDTGTEPYNYIQDSLANKKIALLPQNSSVNIVTDAQFKYAYTTTAKENLTYIENPSVSKSSISVFGLEFFLNNEYLLDFTNKQVGLKNN